MSTRISKPDLYLEGIKGLLKGHTIAFQDQPMTFGRTSQNDVCLAENPVSRQHAKIWRDVHGVWLEDLRSKNGTLLNDKLIAPNIPTKVQLSDVVTLGSSSFRLVQSAKAVSSMPVDFDDAPDPTRTRHPHSIEEYLAKAQSPFLENPISKTSKPSFSFDKFTKRQKMYGGLGGFILLLWLSTLLPKGQTTSVPSLSSYQQQTEMPAGERPDINLENVDSPSLIEIPSILAKAKSAMRFEDYRQAMMLFEQILTVRTHDETIESFWKTAQTNLYNEISRHEKLATMEYQKLEYEKALAHWKRVLELSDGFDQTIYTRTQETIASLEKEIRSL